LDFAEELDQVKQDALTYRIVNLILKHKIRSRKYPELLPLPTKRWEMKSTSRRYLRNSWRKNMGSLLSRWQLTEADSIAITRHKTIIKDLWSAHSIASFPHPPV